MNKTIKLSLIAFILVGGGNLALADVTTNAPNGGLISSLANKQVTISKNETIISNTYQSPTDINHTGGVITIGKAKETHTLSNLNINTKDLNDKNYLLFQGDLTLDKVNIINTEKNDKFNLLFDNRNSDNKDVVFNESILDGVKIDLWTVNVGNSKNLIVNKGTLNNVNIGSRTIATDKTALKDKDINFRVVESEINSGDFSYKTTFDNSQVNGNITGQLNFTNKSKIDATIKNGNVTLDDSEISGSINVGNLTATNSSIIGANSTISGKTDISDSTIKADISSQNLNIKNSIAIGTIDKKINIYLQNSYSPKDSNNNLLLTNVIFNDVKIGTSNNRIDLNGNNTFNKILVENTSPKGTGHHITLGNNASATFNESEFVNTAINNYAWNYNNITTFNKSKFTDTSIGSASAASFANVFVIDSEINNTDTNATIGGGTIYFKNSKINSDFTGGHIYFDTQSTIKGTLKGSVFHLNDIIKSVINNDIKVESGGISAFETLNLDGKKDFIGENTSLNFLVENNSELKLNNLNISNSGINSWKYNTDESTNNKIYISNSNLNEVGIGSKADGGVKFLTDYLSLDNVDINNTQANTTIYAKVIDIKGGKITTPMITALNQVHSRSESGKDFFNVNKIGTFVNVDNAVINSSIEAGELHLKNNSVLNGNIQGTHKVFIDNSTLNGNITKDNRSTCYEQEGCTGEIEDVIITNSTIKGDINEVGNVSLTNTSLEASNVIVKNDISIDNSTSTKAKTITGNFKVGNDFKSSNTIIQGSINTTNNMELNNSNIKGDITANNLTLNNSSITNKADGSTNTINVTNDLTINNESQTTITGNFQVGNDFKSSNTIIQGSINTTNNMELNNSNIKGDITANNLTLNNSSITNKVDGSTNTINVTNDLTINNESQTTIDGNFQVGNDFKSSNTIFSGDIKANKLLSDNKSTFQGNVSADSINAVGSTFEHTLTITGDSKNNVLDKATLEQGIVIDSKDAQVSVINGSEIKGEIKNEGFINVEEGSTVSEKVTGNGILKTDGAFYEDNVSMGEVSGTNNTFKGNVNIGQISGTNNTFKGDVIITNTNTEVKADNNTFLGNVSVNNGKLIATTNNNFKDINANNIEFKNDDIKTTDEIKAQTIKVDDKLVIKNIDLKTTSISANKGEITNSNVFLNNTNEGSKDTKVFLKGKDDNASSVYDKAEITSGDYTIEKSAIKGGIRANNLTTTNSKIVGQLAVNNLNATHSTFYITGGGYNTSLYNHFSGAIIARYGASGFNNIINISNTNLGLLINGYVPIAIINNTINSNTTNSNSTRADMIAAAPKVVSEDFFKVTYTTPISSVLLSPNLVHYTTMQDENGTKEVWSVGLAGKELSKDEIQAIIDGKGNVNYTTTNKVDKNYQEYFMSEILDNETKAELKSIINTPYYVAKNQAEILNDRFTYLRDDIKNHGFWVNNSYNYLKTNYNDLRNKGTSVGIDKNISLDRFNLTYGVFANISRLEINKALSSSTNVRSFGAYASTNFYNGSFIDYSLAYVTLKNKFEAKKIDLYTTNYLDLYQIGLGLGHRFSINNNYLEPNIKLIATRYKDLDLKGTNASIETKKGLQASIKAGVKAGVEFNKNFSLVTELQYFKDLNALSNSKVVALLENNLNNIQDNGLNAKIGFLVKPNSKLDINADFTKNISNEFDTGYRLNLGFSYKF